MRMELFSHLKRFEIFFFFCISPHLFAVKTACICISVCMHMFMRIGSVYIFMWVISIKGCSLSLCLWLCCLYTDLFRFCIVRDSYAAKTFRLQS